MKTTGYRPGLESLLGPGLSAAVLNGKRYPKALWFTEPTLAGLYFPGVKTSLTGILNNINQDSEQLVK